MFFIKSLIINTLLISSLTCVVPLGVRYKVPIEKIKAFANEYSVEQAEATLPVTSYDINKEIKNRPGMIGRIVSQDLGINVAVFQGDVYYRPKETQTIIDNEDSAATFTFNTQTFIGDHNYQSMSPLLADKDLTGTVVAYIKPDGIEYYKFMAKYTTFKNMSIGYFDDNGNPCPLPCGDTMVLSTCRDETGNYMVLTYWEKIE